MTELIFGRESVPSRNGWAAFKGPVIGQGWGAPLGKLGQDVSGAGGRHGLSPDGESS